jgi:putative ABC transport system ATP-binding protein
MTDATPAVRTRALSKTYAEGRGNAVHALVDVDLEIPHGQRVAIMGTSGSGKSTLLNLVGTLDEPTKGTVLIDDTDPSTLGDDERSRLRNEKIGFVFQQFNLIARMTALHNVALALVPRGVERATRLERAREVLDDVGLGDRTDHRPNELSGGQQQRVAVARALVTEPPILLADEPTGQVDTETSERLMNLFADLNERLGITIVIVTHDPTVENHVGRTVYLRDGHVVDAASYAGALA